MIWEKLIATPIIGAILQPIVTGALTAQKQKLDAAGSHEARVTELALKAQELDAKEADVNAKVIIAEQGNWFTRSVRPALGFAVVVLVWKLIVYDKALGQWTGGHTDMLDKDLWNVVMVIIGAYMGGRSAEKVATTIASAFGKRG